MRRFKELSRLVVDDYHTKTSTMTQRGLWLCLAAKKLRRSSFDDGDDEWIGSSADLKGPGTGERRGR